MLLTINYSIHEIWGQKSNTLTLLAIELKKLLEQKLGFLNVVRTQEEFKKENIERALNINDKAEDTNTHINKLDKATPTYLLRCQEM